MVAEVYPAAVLGPSSPFVGILLALGGEEADGGIAQGLGQEELTRTSGPNQQHAFVPGEKFRGDCGGLVEVLKAASLLGAGIMHPRFRAPVNPVVDLVG